MGKTGASISVSSLVLEAGVSRSAFYVHFSDLSDFALALQRTHFDAIARAAQHGRATHPRQAMLQAQRELVTHFAVNRDLYRMTFTLSGAFGTGQGTASAIEQSIRRHIDDLDDLPPEVRPDLAAAYIAGAATNLIASWVFESFDADEETIARHLFALMPSWMYSDRHSTPHPAEEPEERITHESISRPRARRRIRDRRHSDRGTDRTRGPRRGEGLGPLPL